MAARDFNPGYRERSGAGHAHTWRAVAAAGVVAFGAGCMVGPDYDAPKTEMPGEFTTSDVDPAARVSTVTYDDADVARWWTVLADDTLDSLIDRAVAANLDLKAAGSRVRQARAARGVAAGGLWPDVSASASATRRRSPIGNDGGVTGNLFQVGLDASWELDVFGGIRRSVEAADADVVASEHDRRDVLVTLTSEVALNYVDLRGLQEELRVARENLASQERTLDITRRKFEGGLTTRLDVTNSEAQVAATRSAIPALRAAAAQAVYNLGVLIGREPTALDEELAAVGPIPAVPAVIPVGLPSDLLRRRPDIMAAEARIHAATARIGVATADLFPKFSLTGAFGLSSVQLSNFLDAAGRSWSIGAGATWSLFNGGRVRANIALNEARTEEAFLFYSQTVLIAMREVQTALQSFEREQERMAALRQSVEADRLSADFSRTLYAEGQTDFLSVLDAQRSLLVSEDALARSRQALTTDLITLYKALGGGWETFEEQDAEGNASASDSTERPSTAGENPLNQPHAGDARDDQR